MLSTMREIRASLKDRGVRLNVVTTGGEYNIRLPEVIDVAKTSPEVSTAKGKWLSNNPNETGNVFKTEEYEAVKYVISSVLMLDACSCPRSDEAHVAGI